MFDKVLNMPLNPFCPFFSLLSSILYTLKQIELLTCRSSHSQVFSKISVLKNLATFTGKELCWNLFLKRDSNTGVFM